MMARRRAHQRPCDIAVVVPVVFVVVVVVVLIFSSLPKDTRMLPIPRLPCSTCLKHEAERLS
ncbi:hypothetical protein IF1G_01810 [Cordyceps javanica]|uniref:Uncharacterized protein n=1 Tax=Cordyceps javanica TaxID=43265 RepID=A0A545VCZ5_9HYPO|nr:hypothetical protein IF1G_01810 [Cordyceps javanica]